MSRFDYNLYGSYFDKETLNEIEKIKNKIKEEEEKEIPDTEEIYKLKLAQRLKGLGTKGISTRNNRSIFPY